MYTYQNGYLLTIDDLMDAGIVLRLTGDNREMAILLSPDVVSQVAKHLYCSLGQPVAFLPYGLDKTLGRLLKKEPLERGDMQRLKDTKRYIRKWQKK